MSANTTGQQNTAIGAQVLSKNAGSFNTAGGMSALSNNTTGEKNVALGVQALFNNTTAPNNVAIGLKALFSNTTGQSNTAIGYTAGYNLTTGSYNIVIGTNGAAGDDKTIRIGTQGTHISTFIAGINGSAVTGADVVVNGSGRLGVVASSARFKKDIDDMNATTDNLMKLRPVTFKYRDDAQGVTQYGLVAEEVEKVYPELVTYDADGKVESVRYSMLTSMLLNELQKERRLNAEQTLQLREMARLTASLEKRLASVESTIAGNPPVATAYSQ